MDFDMLKCPLTAWEMGDNVYTDAHMDFDLKYMWISHT